MSTLILAGMRVVVLNDLARFRLQSISFFILILLLSAAAVQLAWNYLRRDFGALPRITYGKSLAVVMLWGLLFVIVLAMISGARELMTPGAWEKQQNGGYRLANSEVDEVPPPGVVRNEHLRRLQAALWSYAASNGGEFPPGENEQIPEPMWLVPEQPKARYIYLRGQKPSMSGGSRARPLVYEPGSATGPRLVLLTDGRIEVMRFDEIQKLLLQDVMVAEGQ